MKKLPPSRIAAFRKKVAGFYAKNGRDLPWRHTKDPYHILVSEIMLQQTQVDRVIEKYLKFIQTFPTLTALAEAPLNSLLAAWQGLGYNRRALLLQKCAREIVEQHNGAVPASPDALVTLPGLGKATAASICAFAFNMPVIFIETNIRTVFLHEFFPDQKDVPDDKLVPLIEQTIDTKNACSWYSALMDYGTFLKKQYPNPSRRSAHHATQSKFEGSDRQIRGKIVRLLLKNRILSVSAMQDILQTETGRLEKIVTGMVRDGLVCVKKPNQYFIKTD